MLALGVLLGGDLAPQSLRLYLIVPLQVCVNEFGPLGDGIEEVRDLIVLLLELHELIGDLPDEGHVPAREALAG